MDLKFEQPVIGRENELQILPFKRKINSESEVESNKKLKNNEVSRNSVSKKKEEPEEEDNFKEIRDQKPTENEKLDAAPSLKAPCSPKKRLELSTSRKLNKEKFIYGNYSQYYGYRHKSNDCRDVRLDVFAEHSDIFKNKQMLDIGCNNGFITMEVTKKFDVKSSVGLDIDKSLINQATKKLIKLKKALPMDNELKKQNKFPFNITFVHGNYILKDDVLLEIEGAQFDVILCLSITKWIHLNFGDSGLKQAFKRMFLQLKPQGKLILEAQPYDNYGRRKKLTDTIYKNFKKIKFFPKDFTDFLLSSEVGFSKVDLMGVPDHCINGFKRPVHIFFKA